MKKLTLSLVAIAALSFASCKKNYTCECTYKISGIPDTKQSFTFKNTKSKAKTSCDALSISAGSSSTSCVIK
jgi:hypothetical protein